MEENIKSITNKPIRIAVVGSGSENLHTIQDFFTGSDAVRFHEKTESADVVINVSSDVAHQSLIPQIYLETESNDVIIKVISDLLRALEMNFTISDYIQIRQHQIPFDNILRHLQYFQSGIATVNLVRPASPGDGLVSLHAEKTEEYANFFENARRNIKCTKFVPASGAASRMFKFLNEFLSDFDSENESVSSYISRKKATQLEVFLAGIEKFPFYNELISELRQQFADFTTWPRTKRNYHFIKMLLQGDNFNFASKPKGVLPFHKYDSYVATPVDEHLKEAIHYACSENTIHLHFTVTEEHQPLFEEILNNLDKSEFSGYKTDVTFSYQEKSTDTIAVTPGNAPFRENGKLVFRPGGHGALITNLNNLDTDLVFIKNIDNITHDDAQTIGYYKKVLGGVLFEMQQKVFALLKDIESANYSSHEIVAFMQSQLNIAVDEKWPESQQRDFIRRALDRPIRVCGMVKNEGEPGGGPFWVKTSDGVSLQIVETSQVDLQNAEQRAILASAKYFNPVDIVCGIKRFNGEKFDLNEFVDHQTGFIVHKTKGGKELKGYELPGLWNGGMANWITIFVEVPLSTFNPVKTVNDLLKPAHQPS